METYKYFNSTVKLVNPNFHWPLKAIIICYNFETLFAKSNCDRADNRRDTCHVAQDCYVVIQD